MGKQRPAWASIGFTGPGNQEVEALAVAAKKSSWAWPVYMALKAHLNKAGRCWPSHETLVKLTCLRSKSRIEAGIKALVSAGLVIIEAVGSGRRSNRYRLPLVPAHRDTTVASQHTGTQDDGVASRYTGGQTPRPRGGNSSMELIEDPPLPPATSVHRTPVCSRGGGGGGPLRDPEEDSIDPAADPAAEARRRQLRAAAPGSGKAARTLSVLLTDEEAAEVVACLEHGHAEGLWQREGLRMPLAALASRIVEDGLASAWPLWWRDREPERAPRETVIEPAPEFTPEEQAERKAALEKLMRTTRR